MVRVCAVHADGTLGSDFFLGKVGFESQMVKKTYLISEIFSHSFKLEEKKKIKKG